MNDKQQLAAMGEHMASMKLTIHGHGINSEEEASGGFLTRCLPCSSQQQQTPCMAKRIEELEAQVRVMAGLLREAQRYVQYRLDYTECDARIVMGLIYDIESALAGKLPAPVAPEGWQLVPVEPTMAMISSATAATTGFGTRAQWDAMLAAAPNQEAK